NRALQKACRLLESPKIRKRCAHTVFDCRGNGADNSLGIRPKSQTILPAVELSPRDHEAGTECQDSCAGSDPAGAMQLDGAGSCAPNNDDEYTDERPICVTVRHGLLSNLDDADHRNQCPQKPEPANHKPGRSPVKTRGGDGDHDQGPAGPKNGR